MRLVSLLTVLLLFQASASAVVTTASPAPRAQTPRGWNGPDLKAALLQARRTHRPLLLFIRQDPCSSCDLTAAMLTTDPGIRRLTRSFLRLWVSLDQKAGIRLARRFNVVQVPAVLLLGPAGHVATRQEGHVTRAWLQEQLAIVARRHAGLSRAPNPDVSALEASLNQLQEYGDRQGAEEIRRRLRDGETPLPAAAALEAEGDVPAIHSEGELRQRLSLVEEPQELRDLSYRLAGTLEDSGRPELALKALEMAGERLGIDALTEARAGFLAARQNILLGERRQHLMELREMEPRSLPLLLALMRVAEQTDHLFQAFHTAEAAAIYQPEDAWTSLELHRLRFLVLIATRTVHDPT